MSNEGDGFSGHRIKLSSGPVHYRELGSGEPLLFVHGWGVHGGLWTETATRLAASGHRCIVPDLPFGSHREAMSEEADLSPTGAARLISELITSLGLDGVTVVANDSGGAVSQILVTEHPERISRLVLTNCDALEEFPPGVFKVLVKMLGVPGFMTVLANSLRFRFNQVSPLAYGSLSHIRLSEELLSSWVRPPIEDHGVRRDSRKFGSQMDPRYTLAAAEKLPQLEIPVLLLWGEDDKFFTTELAERLAELIPDSRLVRVAEALTFVSLDQPERVATEIARFVTEKPAGARLAA